MTVSLCFCDLAFGLGCRNDDGHFPTPLDLKIHHEDTKERVFVFDWFDLDEKSPSDSGVTGPKRVGYAL